MPLGQWWLWRRLTRRYIWAWDWLRGGEVVFPSNTDWVKVVALGELTLWDRLMSWAADVVARLICTVHKGTRTEDLWRNQRKYTQLTTSEWQNQEQDVTLMKSREINNNFLPKTVILDTLEYYKSKKTNNQKRKHSYNH